MRHVLVTGATGALGSALTPLFAKDPDTRVTLLMRAESPAHLQERRRRLLDFLQPTSGDSNEQLDRCIDAVRGDTSSPRLGMSDTDYTSLAKTTTHVVHSAGNVKLNQAAEEARRAAVGSAETIVGFVQQCQEKGRFKKLEFVSTVGVAGRRAGVFPEQRVEGQREAAEFHNTYEAAKWEAEKYLWQQIDRGLPATVHRPSMIVGDSTSGRIIRFQVFYHLIDFLLGRRTRGLVPRTGDAILDIVPVDYVAKAIVLASEDSATIGQVWHLCSGPTDSWQLDKLVAAARRLLTLRGESVPKTRPLSPRTFRLALQAMSPLMPAQSKRFLSGLPYLLDYLDEKQIFDNQQTTGRLLKKDLKIPAVDTYLGIIMNAYWDRTRQP